MALTPATITVMTKANDPYNIIEEAAIEIRVRNPDGTSGNLSVIYSDEAGLIPITQPGAKSDLNGQFVFYAKAARYNAVYNNGGNLVTQPAVIGSSGEVSPLDINTNALTVTGVDHGVLFNISSSVGDVLITAEQSLPESVGSIIFFKSDTDSLVSFVLGVGVTIKTAYTFDIFARNSMVSLLVISETEYLLVGDLKQ